MHARLPTGLQHAGELVRFAFADHAADRRRGRQHFKNRQSAAPRAPHQPLGYHRLQAAGQLGAHIGFIFRRKHVHQPLDRLRRTAGVQRRQHQMAGFRRGKRQADGRSIAQLTQQDHVRILPQGGAQRAIKAVAVAADFTLLDQRAPAVMNKLDRIFQRENMPPLVPVDLVDHRRQGGGFAAAGSAGHQEQAVFAPQQRRNNSRRCQCRQRRAIAGNPPQRQRYAPVLQKSVYAQPNAARPLQR